MKQAQYILLMSLLLSACTTITTETLFFEQLTYTEKSSFLTRRKYRFNPDETAREPIRKASKMVLIKDSTTQLSYSFKERLKRSRKHGEFYLQKVDFDTSVVNKKATIVTSDFNLIGAYNPPKNVIRYSVFTGKGIVFKGDGSCIETYRTTQNETAYSSLNRRLGEYKIVNDTLYIVYFLRKGYSSMFQRNNPSFKSIDDVSWSIMKPYCANYVMSAANDTLRLISKGISSELLVAADSVTLLPKNANLHQTRLSQPKSIIE